MKSPRFHLLLLLTSLTFWSCSVKKNNFFSRAYHGTTTHYNFYFNARERMKQGAATLADAHEDKYDRVLSIFKIGDLNKAKAVFPDFDEAIKKASIAITRHSINVKGKNDRSIREHNAWIPECYMVVGQSQFYKHDFWSSIETFQYISSEYKDDEIRPEALLWLTRSYLELGKTTDAEYLLDYLKADKKFPIRLRGFYNAVLAQYHLQKNDVPRAMSALQMAASTSKKKDDRSRYYFILGQLYQRADTLPKAFDAYQKVLRLNPPYEMAFNARINRARCYDVGSGSADIVKRELQKMLKDEKNKEYRDQIYYALAGVAQQEKKEDLSVELLNKSIQASTSNTTQKSLSYLSLANIYLKRPEYIPAAAYYDSCLTNLTNDHPDYFDIQAKRNSLDRLVKNLKVIITEDSLQHLASLSLSEREALIGKLVEAEDAEKERLKQEKEEQQRLEEQQVLEEKELKSQPRAMNQPATAAGAWYFYNQSAISFGYNEFLKRWGNRKQEDNWRRSEKELVMSETQDTATVDSSQAGKQALNDSIAKLDSKARKEAYLGQIPDSPAQLEESNLKIAEAYYNCGVIYKEQLNNLPESINSFETLDKRYPANKYKQPSYYNLYRTYTTLGDSAKANFYKNYILANYPESDYARLIQNPNFFMEMKRKSEVLEVFYENTYRAFLNRQYDQVIERKEYADQSFPANNKLSPKFAFLKAMAVGKTRPINDFQFELEDVIRRYPKDSVSFRAKEILDYIKGNDVKTTALDTLPVDTNNLKDPFAKSAKYTYDPNSLQFFVILYQKASLVTNELINKIKAFNNIDFPEQQLTVNNGNIDLNIQYIAVMSFNTRDDAMMYYETIVSEDNLVNQYDPQQVQYYVISQDNLSELTRTKDMKAYSQFFQQKYLQ
ncbi:MAG: tetratricopeptide repeat protein [Bacteroidia bacterium]|nr:tetratricopeptide repeat protein [Bacteroidia bacterium]